MKVRRLNQGKAVPSQNSRRSRWAGKATDPFQIEMDVPN